MSVQWKEPPAPAGPAEKPVKYQDIADELRSRPGEWALVQDDAWASFANQITAGSLKAFRPRGAFEGLATDKRDYGRRATVYARFNGDPAPTPAEPLDASEEPVGERSEADIRADERERIATRLEGMRTVMWNGSTRKVNNADYFARFIRGMNDPAVTT